MVAGVEAGVTQPAHGLGLADAVPGLPIQGATPSQGDPGRPVFALLGLDHPLDVQCTGQPREIAGAAQESCALVEGGTRRTELTALIQVPRKPAECLANLVVIADGRRVLDAFQEQRSDLRELPLVVGQVRHREQRPGYAATVPELTVQRETRLVLRQCAVEVTARRIQPAKPKQHSGVGRAGSRRRQSRAPSIGGDYGAFEPCAALNDESPNRPETSQGPAKPKRNSS